MPAPAIVRTIAYYYKNYRNRLIVVTFLLVLASVAETIGVASLLPIVSIVTQPDKLIELAQKLPMGDELAAYAQTVSQATVLITLLTTLVVAIFLKSTLVLLAIRSAGYAVSQIAKDYRLRLVESLIVARWHYFTEKRSGSLVNTITSEPERAAQCFSALTRFQSTFFQFIVYSLLALQTSITVTVSAALIGLILFVAVRFLTRLHREACIEQAQERDLLSSWLNDAVTSMKSLKAMNQGSALATLIDTATMRLEKLMQREIISKAALQFMIEPIFTIVLAVGIVVFTQIAPIDIALLLFMALLFQRLMANVSQLLSNYQLVVGLSGVLEKLETNIEDIENSKERNTGDLAPDNWSSIRLKDIDFSYNSNSVLSDFSLQIQRNTLTVIQGPSGSGKTTLIDLIVGLATPNSGNILIDDADLTSIRLDSWRSQIGYVPQETLLLNSSIRHNLCLDAQDISDDHIWKALSQAGLEEMVRQMPNGLDSNVGERGGMLSGGQRQRLSITRALLRKPQIIILDEATSALDAETSDRIANLVSQLSKSITIVAISHKDEFNSYADQILKMSKVSKDIRIETR